MAKYKATGCARFFMFLVVFLPIAYFGSQYLMESGKIDGIRDKIESITKDEGKSSTTTTVTTDGVSAEVEAKLKQLVNKVKEQELTIEKQRRTIADQRKQIQQLQNIRTTNTTNSRPPAQTEPAQKPSKNGTSLEELLKEADNVIKKN